MKVVSFRTLQQIPELSDFNELQLLHPSLDKLVHYWLGKLAMDVDYPVEYFFSNHRDSQNKTGFGFQARGESSVNRLDLNGPFSDLTDRLVASNYLDPSLTKELLELSNKSLDYLQWSDALEDENENRWPLWMLEDGWEDAEKKIDAMNALVEQIRGSKYNASGSLKEAEEYHSERYDAI